MRRPFHGQPFAISALNWLAGTGSLFTNVQTAVSFKGLPLADIVSLAVTRQPRGERAAEMLWILLILQETTCLLIIARTVEMACLRVISAALV